MTFPAYAKFRSKVAISRRARALAQSVYVVLGDAVVSFFLQSLNFFSDLFNNFGVMDNLLFPFLY